MKQFQIGRNVYRVVTFIIFVIIVFGSIFNVTVRANIKKIYWTIMAQGKKLI